MELKAKIINTANLLMDLFECCQDEDLVETIIDAIRYNDKEPLWNLEEQLELTEEEKFDEYEYDM